MIAKISQGDRMAGLLAYLVGPGRANEHASPHLVAGDSAMMEWHHETDPETGQALDVGRDQALRIARHLDRPRRAFGTTVADGHVFHCSLSLAAREGELSDERWRQISEAFVERMGLGDDAGTKAPTRWVAVRHGLSAGGNDHVHLVVNLVREDGTKVSVHQSQVRARDLCRELEREFGLEELESAGRERASVGFEYGEREAAGRRRARGEFEQARRAGAETRTWSQLPAGERGALVEAATREDQPRWELARKVRACATSSVDEAEFVRRLRQHGVLARPRYADGHGPARRSDHARGADVANVAGGIGGDAGSVVVGYSVAAKPAAGERPIWYGGGRLAKDLTLPRLRAEWAANPHGNQVDVRAAAAEWDASRAGRRPAAPGREVVAVDPQVWQQVNVELRELRERLQGVPIEDRDTWARVARQTAGAFSAWSTRVESTPGPLAATADALARSAETTRAATLQRPGRAAAVPVPSAAGAAYLLLAATSGNTTAAQLVVIRQLASLAKALHDMHRAEGALRRAYAIEHAVRADLNGVAKRLDDQGAARNAAARQAGDVSSPDESAKYRRDRTSPIEPAGRPVSDEQVVEAVRRVQQGQMRPGVPGHRPDSRQVAAEENTNDVKESRRSRGAGRDEGPEQ